VAAAAALSARFTGLVRQMHVHLGVEHPLGQRFIQVPDQAAESSTDFGSRPASGQTVTQERQEC
jgi:hypothetical protein